MKLQETQQGIVVEIYVKPRSNRFHVKVEDYGIVVYSKETPVKDRVNRELIKEFSKIFRRRVQIISGFTSRQKKLLIADTNTEYVREILSAYESK